jgi:RecB family exonuclease
MPDPLRQSTIYSYLRCPYQHHLRTTDPRSQRFRNPAAMFGTVIHELLAQMHTGKWDMDLENSFLEAFEAEVTKRQNDKLTLPLKWKDEIKERAKHLEDAVSILNGYRDKSYNHDCKILLAEATFSVKLGRQTVTGTIDQLRQHPDGTLELLDFKTSKAAPPQAYVDLDYQLALYAHALKHGTFLVDGKLIQPGITPDVLTLYFLRHHIPYKRATKDKLAGEERGDPRITSTRSVEQMRSLKADVSSVARMIRLGLFPRSPDSMKCGCCAYADACRGAAKDAVLSKTKIETLKQELEKVA